MKDYFEESHGNLMSEINVTPFVDVMLVLLVIFMVTAPLMMQGIDVQVPAVEAPSIQTKEERLVISITGDRKVFINEYEVKLEDLVPKLAAIYANKKDTSGVFLKADKNLPYGFVMEVMSKIRQAGIKNIGMITTTPESRQK